MPDPTPPAPASTPAPDPKPPEAAATAAAASAPAASAAPAAAAPATPTTDAAPGAAAAPESAVAAAMAATDPAGSATGAAEKAALAAAAPTEPSATDDVLAQASFEDVASVVPDGSAPDVEAFKLPSFQQVMADAQVSSIDLLRDVELNVKIELGRSRMMVEEVLKLNEGSVVELDKLAGDPVDVFVNDRLVARGEVLVLNDNFCVRVNEIVAGIKEEGL